MSEGVNDEGECDWKGSYIFGFCDAGHIVGYER